ncbi:MAG TPA: MBL fold metallo-hydrolase [Flavobacteriales bacterium]|nr:MBL fold metallo-hydrolase [Flavobacteriales bacterium]
MIEIKCFQFNPFQENTYVLYDESKECVIIDAGCYEEHERQELIEFIDEESLLPRRLINTHCHIDHVFGLAFLAEKYKLGLEIHEKDLGVLEATSTVAQMYGLPNVDTPPAPSLYFHEGDVIEFGNSSLDILFTPGHAPGHVVFVNKEQKFIIGGDVLFYLSIGRTDLPGGDHALLIDSIVSKLLPLGDDFIVHSGHGQSTNIGFEKSNNPFL